MVVPVIDLFAGPGGLGEGFVRSKSAHFEIAVSIEKDVMAFETLRLRAAHHALLRLGGVKEATWELWDRTLAFEPWNVAFDSLREAGDPKIVTACLEASRQTWNFELGPRGRSEASAGIRSRLRKHMSGRRLPENLVLIGGPPCQAYSIVGRSRNRGTDGYRPEHDHRHFLYREYLQVINEFRPAVFVMENVKGILSSHVAGRQIFETITNDLKRPDIACGGGPKVEYVLVALPKGSTNGFDPEPDHYIVEAERFGVPQARHRVIILGVRKDVFARAGKVRKLAESAEITVRDVIDDLPEVRPTLSFRGKALSWVDSLDLPIFFAAVDELRNSGDSIAKRVADKMHKLKARIKGRNDPGPGADRFIIRDRHAPGPAKLAHWYRDRASNLLANHESRAHMPTDLVRYLFISTFGNVAKESPRLSDFPRSLLPLHKNVDRDDPASSIFKDRFRVQLYGRCSMTITSHICKDGHAFIHPNAIQCRSLTVREAARLQTFPDSYVFLGNRTSQYTQVGNAVPPYLASKIADVVGDLLDGACAAS